MPTRPSTPFGRSRVGRFLNAIRSALGMTPPAPPQEHERIQRRLDEQAARLRAMDVQVDAQRKSDRILSHSRRAGDR